MVMAFYMKEWKRSLWLRRSPASFIRKGCIKKATFLEKTFPINNRILFICTNAPLILHETISAESIASVESLPNAMKWE